MTPPPGTTVRATVLHRLALGVEPIDALTGRPVLGELVVEREAPPAGRRRGLADPAGPWPPGIPLAGRADGRHRLLHGEPGPGGVSAPLGGAVVVRLWDRRWRFTPRRLRVELWTLAELRAREAAGTGDLPAAARTLRPTLLPGVGAWVPAGTTGLRGRVTRDGAPVPWARIAGVEPGSGRVLGRAGADERGEFLLVIPSAAWPVAARLTVAARISAAPRTVAGNDGGRTAEDRFAALPTEVVPRPADPPDLVPDTPLLRCETDPDGFVVSTSQPTEQLVVGRVLVRRDPYEFIPPAA
jgi:hypothetical protein